MQVYSLIKHDIILEYIAISFHKTEHSSLIHDSKRQRDQVIIIEYEEKGGIPYPRLILSVYAQRVNLPVRLLKLFRIIIHVWRICQIKGKQVPVQ